MNIEVRRNIYDDKGKEVKPTEDAAKQTNGEGTANGASSSEDTAKTIQDAAKAEKKTINCYTCGIDCTRSRFHYAKGDPPTSNTNPNSNDIKYDLCPNCYYQSKMPNTHRASDFTRMEEPEYSNIPDKDAAWTDTETLLLLEGLENFDTNWDEVANHVGTRTREECVMKFLQLDIQDQYMEDAPGTSTYRASGGREPISQLENPVMSVVSFLAQMADPSVVAAASNRSVEQMAKELRKGLEKGMGSSTTDDSEKEKQKEVKAEDSMDVDSSAPAVQPVTEDSSAQPQPHVISDIATTGLSTAAARSSALATYEERETTRLVGAAVNLTLQKFELKLAQFAEMEEIVQAERRDLERGRQQLFLDQLKFRKRVRDVEGTIKTAFERGGSEGLRMVADAIGGGIAGGYGFKSGSGNEQVPPSQQDSSQVVSTEV